MTSDKVVASTASVISFVASMAASRGSYFFSSMKRTMFSSTTMASSMTMPTASVSASSVMLLSVKSISFSSVKVAMIEVGMATEAITTERQLRMKSSTTRLARMLPNSRCSCSDSIEALMKIDWSRMVRSEMPVGRFGCRAAIFFLTASMISTVLVPDWRRMSRVTASLPSSMFHERGSAKLSAT